MMPVLKYKKLSPEEMEDLQSNSLGEGNQEFGIEDLWEDEECTMIRVNDPKLALWIIKEWGATIESLV